MAYCGTYSTSVYVTPASSHLKTTKTWKCKLVLYRKREHVWSQQWKRIKSKQEIDKLVHRCHCLRFRPENYDWFWMSGSQHRFTADIFSCKISWLSYVAIRRKAKVSLSIRFNRETLHNFTWFLRSFDFHIDIVTFIQLGYYYSSHTGSLESSSNIVRDFYSIHQNSEKGNGNCSLGKPKEII